MRRALIACVAVVLAGAGPLAQEPTAPQQKPTFRSSVQIVEIDARVFDRNGKFVHNLTREDFELIEDGKPQRIETMFLVAGRPQRVGPTFRSGVPDKPEAPAANIATRQTWIFFFDLNHLTPGSGFDRARKAVEDFIRDRLAEGDMGGVVAGDKMVNNRLTSIRQELLDAMKQVKPLSDSRARASELTREVPRLLDGQEALQIARNDREATERAVARLCNDDRKLCEGPNDPTMIVREKAMRLSRDIQRAATLTMSSIGALANGLARLPGPKTVVFLSDGFPVENAETTLRSIVGQTARAGARVYGIDVRGLGRLGGPDPGAAAVEDPSGAAMKFDTVSDAANSLSIDTGGLMIRNENNIGRALDNIAADSSSYYVLGFSPSNTSWDRKFRSVQVRVKRDGVRVRARKGYLGIEPARLVVPQPVPSTASTEPEPAPVAPVAPPATRPEAPPTPATPAVGTVVNPAPAPESSSMRLRPDAADKVRELAGSTTAAGDAATRGWEAYQRGDVEAAIGPLQQAAAAPDARPWVLYALGFAQVGVGRPADAVDTWERVRAAVPNFAAVYMDLAATYTSMSDLSKALGVLRDAEQRWPRDPEVHNAIGVIHFRRGALDDAISAFGRAAAVAPRDPLAYMNLGRAYEARYARSRRYVTSQRMWTADEGDRRKAIENYEQYVRLGGPYVDAAREALQRLEWSK